MGDGLTECARHGTQHRARVLQGVTCAGGDVPTRRGVAEAPTPWGLPTATCPATPYLLEQYPRLHAQWKRSGRLLVHCARSAALGNYVLSIPAALLLSILLERALILECDEPAEDLGRTVELSSQLRRYWRGPHFDWVRGASALAGRPINIVATFLWGGAARGQRRQLPLPPGGVFSNGSEVYLGSSFLWLAGKTVPEASAMSPSKLAQLLRRYSTIRLYNGQAEDARSLLTASPQVAAFLASRLGALASLDTPPQQLLGCLLRYILAPTPLLARLQQALIRHRPADGPLLRTATLHTRLGDGVWMSQPGVRAAWKFAYEVHDDLALLQRAPEQVVRCLLLASAEVSSRGGRAGWAGVAPSMRFSPASLGGCLRPVVLSDSILMERCARAISPGVVVTPGLATHPLVSNVSMIREQRNRDKVFLDWWLIARSQGMLSVGRPVSSFFASARAFRDASAPGGWWLSIPPIRKHGGAAANGPPAPASDALLPDETCSRRTALQLRLAQPGDIRTASSRRGRYGLEAPWAAPTVELDLLQRGVKQKPRLRGPKYPVV